MQVWKGIGFKRCAKGEYTVHWSGNAHIGAAFGMMSHSLDFKI